MEKITIGFVFNRKKKANKQGLFSVDMRVQLRGERYPKYVTLQNVKKNQWDDKNKRFKNHPDELRLNKKITRYKQKVFEYLDRQRENNSPVLLNDIVRHLKGNDYSSFTAFLRKQIAENKKVSFGTQGQHMNTFNWLCKFREEISFKELNYDFFKRLQSFLLMQDKKKGTGKLSDNYVSEMLVHISIYLQEALRQGLVKENPITILEKKKTKKDPVWLDYPDEVELLENLNIDDLKKEGSWANLQLALDVSLFCIYTGFRVGDVLGDVDSGVNYLSTKMITEEEKGLRIKKQPNKTRNKSRIWVNLPLWVLYDGKPERLVRKYLDRDRSREKEKDRLFPRASHSFVLMHLKSFIKHVGIKKKIKVHTLRHTCAMGLLNHYKVRLEVVQKILGHSSITSTEIYARLNDNSLDEELENL